MAWALQDAKNRFSEVVLRARRDGPQIVTLRGKPAVVVLSTEEYERLAAGRPSIVDHILSGPPWPDDLVEVVNARSKQPGRDVEF